MKNYVSGVVLGLLLGGAIAAGAQAPAVRPDASGLDATEQLLVQLIAAQAKIASTECNALESMKTFASTRAEVVKRVEAAHPGFTLNLQTAKLVKKP